MSLSLIGALAALVSTVMFLPQTLQAWKARGDLSALQGISMAGTGLALTQSVLWIIYNVGIHNTWGWLPHLVIVPGLLLTIGVVVYTVNAHHRAARFEIPEAMREPLPPLEPAAYEDFDETAQMPAIQFA